MAAENGHNRRDAALLGEPDKEDAMGLFTSGFFCSVIASKDGGRNGFSIPG